MVETITQAEALDWLAGLEKNCSDCQLPDSFHVKPELDKWCQPCGGSGKVPVLDLREPCPCLGMWNIDCCSACYFQESTSWHWQRQHDGTCLNCQGSNGIPKQGETALHQAMNKAGWSLRLWWGSSGMRWVTFASGPPDYRCGEDANDWLAAAKAMKAVMKETADAG